MLSRSWAEVNPHHKGEAYIREASVVMVATTCICCSLRPWALSILKVWMDEGHEAHEASRWSRWSLFDSLEMMIIPSTLIVVTLSAPLTIGSLGPRSFDLLLKTISSLV